MIRSLWIAKTGLDAQQTQLDVISNNLANVSTNGFKRARAVFEDLLYQTLRQPGAQSSQQTQLPSGSADRHRRASGGHRAHLHPGQPAADQQPARRRDQRPGLLPGADARRHHRLHARRLVPARQPGPAGDLERLSRAAGDHHPAECADHHDRQRRHRHRHCSRARRRRPRSARCSSPTSSIRPACRAAGENLYLETAVFRARRNVDTPASTAWARCSQGYVETSNVNVVEELVNMIQTQRAYEINSQGDPDVRPDAAAAVATVADLDTP